MKKRALLKLFDYVGKAALSRPRCLHDLLQANLPEYIVELVEWDAISMLSEALKEDSEVHQRQIHADMLVQLPLSSSLGSACVVIELKSEQRDGYEQQLDRYSREAMRKHSQCGYFYRLLFYTGRVPWRAKKQALPPEPPPELAPELAALAHQRLPETIIADVHDPELLKKLRTVEMRAVVLTLRDMWDIPGAEQYWQFIDRVLLPVLDVDRKLFQLLLWYSLQMIPEEVDIDSDAVMRYIDNKQGGAKAMREMRTVADRLRDERRAEGAAKAMREMRTVADRLRDEGERMGIDKGRAEVADRMLRKNFDSDVVREVTGLSVAEIDALRHTPNGSHR